MQPTQRGRNSQVFTLTADSRCSCCVSLPPVGEPQYAITSAVSIQDNEIHTKGFIATPILFFLVLVFCFVLFFTELLSLGTTALTLFLFKVACFSPPEFYSLKYFNIVAFKRFLGNCSVFTLEHHQCIWIIFHLLLHVQRSAIRCTMSFSKWSTCYFFMYINIYVYIQSACITSLSFILAFLFFN